MAHKKKDHMKEKEKHKKPMMEEMKEKEMHKKKKK